MIIKGQDGKEHDIYEISTSGKCIYCKDNADRRKKHLLGNYDSKFDTVTVYQRILNCTSGYFEMPSRGI